MLKFILGSLNNLAFSLMGALALSCFFRNNWAPWCDLDLIFRRTLETFLSTSRDKRWSANETAWKSSYDERVGLLKYAVWGLVLILILPLNSITSSSWFIDELWNMLEGLRHGISRATGDLPLFFHTHEWRDAPYELWEICVFIWVFPIIGRWIKRDYVRLVRQSLSTDAERHVRTGQHLAILVFCLSTLGVFFLVVVQAPRYRVLVELLVVGVLGVADLYFCRRWLKGGQMVDAIKHLEVFLMIDLGSLVAFLALFLFLEMTNLSYRSHWSSAFVAGASALNLLFTNTASLVSRGMQNYREQRQLAEDGRASASSGGGSHG